MPRPEPAKKPPSASLNVYQPAGQRVERSFQSAFAISVGFGSRNCCTWRASIEPSQIPSTRDEDDERRNPLAEPAAATRQRSHRRLLLRQKVLAPPAQQLAHLGDELEEARVLARLDRARVRQVDATGLRSVPAAGS